MKKRKIVVYSIIAFLLLACVGLGTASLVMGDKFTNNNISFQVNDSAAYCKVTGKYFYNGEEQAGKSYDTQVYSQSSDLQPTEFGGFPVWNIGESHFDREYQGKETLKYQITIENLNPSKALQITLADVAVGEKIKTNNSKVMCFFTTITYQVDQGAQEVQFSNKTGEEVNNTLYTSGQQVIDINTPKSVPVASQIIITIELERNTNTESFNLANNFTVGIATAE